MPYLIAPRGRGKYEVINTETREGKGITTKEKAEKQRRLLYAVAAGWKPRK